jgi:hypothetical protein
MATPRRGRPRKFEDPTTISLRFERGFHRKLSIVAATRAVSLNDLVVTGLTEWLAEQPEAASATRLTKRAAKPKPTP